jgi:eukaryotic translation initiation factor 2-alpha kinase 4
VKGRGGGGEVVKAKNRLDRRVYAVKKIVLESEKGRNASFAASQNRKLLREVTTISRMTHINIVRYYQAWIEGGIGTSDASVLVVEEVNHETTNIGEDSVEVENSSSESSGAGWWTNSPNEESPLSRLQNHDVAQKNVQRSSLSDIISEDGESDTINLESTNLLSSKLRRDDISSSLDEDINQMFANPLLSGLGIKSSHRDNFDSSQNSDDSDSDGSSVKVVRKNGESILYIQMEFCSTTLRELIDNRAIERMENNEIWRLIRQILDALAYLHSRNVIHRDLVRLTSGPDATFVSLCRSFFFYFKYILKRNRQTFFLMLKQPVDP